MCVAMKAAMIALLPALWPIRNLTSELPCSPSNALPPAGERRLHYITLPDRGGTRPSHRSRHNLFTARFPLSDDDRRRRARSLHRWQVRPVRIRGDLPCLRSAYRRGLLESRPGRRSRRRGGNRRRPRGVRRAVGRAHAEGPRQVPPEARPDHPRGRRIARAARGEEHRPSDPRRAPVRPRADGRLVRVLRRHGDEDPGRRDPVVVQGRPQLHVARAPRRRRPDRPVELPPHVRGVERGGKGPNVIFEDADLDAAVQGSLFAAYHNQGQACIAGSRLLVHQSIWDAFLKSFTERVRSIRIGDPLEETTQLGPLTSKDHQKKVLGYVDVAKGEGAEILFGGRVPGTPETARGYYVQPTLVRADDPKMRVCQEED